MTSEIPSPKPWAELTKSERAQRMREGKAKKAAERAAAPKEDVSRGFEARPHLEDIFRPLTEEETKKLTPEQVTARRAALTAAIDSLPAVPVVSGTVKPGTKVGEGLAQDVVPFTAEWFTDIEARQKEDPNYKLHEVTPSKWGFVKVNGVAFGYAPNRTCLLPTPHYLVYMNNLTAPERAAAEFAAPVGVAVQAGYMSPVHLMPGTWSYTPIPKE